MGDAADDPTHTYVVDRGMLVEGVSGGSQWNPLKTGRTSILVRPYFRSKSSGPMARLSSFVASSEPRRLGGREGEIHIAPDFDEEDDYNHPRSEIREISGRRLVDVGD